jgi:hypothetical protein
MALAIAWAMDSFLDLEKLSTADLQSSRIGSLFGWGSPVVKCGDDFYDFS